ncbi:hypothetical protein [Olivibacter ginsenosidimutans]
MKRWFILCVFFFCLSLNACNKEKDINDTQGNPQQVEQLRNYLAHAMQMDVKDVFYDEEKQQFYFTNYRDLTLDLVDVLENYNKEHQ